MYRASLISCLAIWALTPAVGIAQTSVCTGGASAHLATAQEAASANPAGSIQAGVTYVCPDDARLGISDQVGTARMYLKSQKRTGTATNDQNMDALDKTFAVCASYFLKDFQQLYGPITIRSAYRSSAYDAQMCRNNRACGNLMNNPNPMGNHQKALAMDIGVDSGNQRTIWEFARTNPRYGVCFPFTGENGGFLDTVHMILAGIPGTETSGPGCRGVTRACEGAPAFDPKAVPAGNDMPSYETGPAYNPTPQSAFGNPLTSGLMPPPPPMPPFSQQPFGQQPFGSTLPTSSSVPSGTTQGGTGPQICSPRFSCESNIMYYHTSACAKVQYEACKYGCSGTQCALPQSATSSTSTLSSIFSSTAPTSSTIGQSIIPSLTEGFGALLNATSASVSTGSSIGDLLSSFAQQFISGQGETSVGPKATSVPVSLSATLAASTSIRTAVPTAVGTTGPVTVSTLTSEETFTTAQPQVTAQPDRTAIARILELFRSILLWALSVLRLRA